MKQHRGGKSGQSAARNAVQRRKAPGKVTRTASIQRKPPRRAVQARGNAGAADVHSAAEQGVSGASGALPHLDTIQRSFGAHDLGDVRSQVGGKAADACDSMDAMAYATGTHVAFKESPDLHTAAHEAAHVVQQKAGVQLDNNVGAPGDSYERHADAVADAVVSGQSAAPLLDQMASPQQGGGTSAVQRLEAEGSASESQLEPPSGDHEGHQGGEVHVDSAPQVEGEGKKGGPLDKKKALQILQDAFGSYKTMSAGKVEVLSQSDFKDAWEKIYGKTKFAWDKWVVPKHGNLNGFAYKGTNYINKSKANTGTVPHEMLHNNAASDWKSVVGSRFNEGATDYLKQYALKKAGLSSPNSYANELSVVEAWLASGRTEDQLFTAYLKSGAQKIVADWVDDNCKGTWSNVKDKLEAHEWAKAKALLKKKAA